MVNYLMVGGPAHGQERDVPNGETELIIMAPSPGNPLPTPWKYMLRDIEAETRPGVFFSRTILAEQSMPVEVAGQALASVLMQRFAEQLLINFMEGGVRVGSDQTPEPGTSGSGLLIAKR